MFCCTRRKENKSSKDNTKDQIFEEPSIQPQSDRSKEKHKTPEGDVQTQLTHTKLLYKDASSMDSTKMLNDHKILDLKKQRVQCLTYSRSITEEKEYVFKLIYSNEPKTHLLEFRWAYRYTKFLEDGLSFDLKINNLSLLRGQFAEQSVVILSNPKLLRANIKQDRDYVVINESVWHFITGMYGGGPEIKIPSKRRFIQSIQIQRKEIIDDIPEIEQHSPVMPLIGLRCLINAHYINPVIQCMISAEPINSHFLNHYYYKNMRTLHTYQEFIRKVSQLSPGQLTTTQGFQSVAQFSVWDQHDVKEFYQQLVDRMVSEQETESGPITQLFQFEIHFLYSCKQCGKQSTQLYTSNGLVLLLEKSFMQNESNIKRALQGQIVKKDTLTCTSCNLRMVERSRVLTKLPQVMAFSLQRSSSMGFTVTQNLNMKDFTDKSITKTKYKLVGAVAYQSQKGYKAYVKRDKEWCICFDEYLQKCTQSELEREKQICQLFYVVD